MMPVTRMPEKEPWCSSTEFSASENIMGYITDAKKPTIGNATNAIFAEPNKAALKLRIAKIVNEISTILLSNNFSNS